MPFTLSTPQFTLWVIWHMSLFWRPALISWVKQCIDLGCLYYVTIFGNNENYNEKIDLKGRGRDLPAIGSFPKWSQQPRLYQDPGAPCGSSMWVAGMLRLDLPLCWVLGGNWIASSILGLELGLALQPGMWASQAEACCATRPFLCNITVFAVSYAMPWAPDV